MQFNVPLRKKGKEIETTPCVVEKTIELNGDEYAHFCHHLLDDYDFLSENRESMYVDTEGASHCLLVLGEGSDDGVLVESEGNGYTRYSAFVPHARTLMRMDRYSSLQEFNEQMIRNADKYVKQAVENQGNGEYRLSLEGMQRELQPEMFESQLLAAMLEERPEFFDVDERDEELILHLKPEYIRAEEKQRPRISQEQADLMCARHTLWLHDEGGAQADFSGCELADLDLSHRNLEGALFTDALICHTDFDRSQLDGADFTGASLHDCAARKIHAEDAVFSNAVLEDCILDGAIIIHSDFTDARLRDCRMDGTVFEGTDIQGCCGEQDQREAPGPVFSI